MRILSVRVAPVARVLAIAYAVFGLVAFAQYAVGSADSLTLPFGLLLPLFHLNLNFSLPRSSDLIWNVFFCLAAVLSYTLTGWITGAVSAMCFNLICKQTGGIEAKYVSFENDELVSQPTPAGSETSNSDFRSVLP